MSEPPELMGVAAPIVVFQSSLPYADLVDLFAACGAASIRSVRFPVLASCSRR